MSGVGSTSIGRGEYGRRVLNIETEEIPLKKSLGLSVVVSVVMFALLTVDIAHAFSPIWNVNGWDSARLAKAGIAVRPWRHDLQSEDPPLQWVQVTFDCAALPKDEPVVVTAWFRSSAGRTITAVRAERAAAADGKIKLVLCIMPQQIEASSMEVYIWSKLPGDGSEAHGYQLSMQRIAELAREQNVGIPAK